MQSLLMSEYSQSPHIPPCTNKRQQGLARCPWRQPSRTQEVRSRRSVQAAIASGTMRSEAWTNLAIHSRLTQASFPDGGSCCATQSRQAKRPMPPDYKHWPLLECNVTYCRLIETSTFKDQFEQIHSKYCDYQYEYTGCASKPVARRAWTATCRMHDSAEGGEIVLKFALVPCDGTRWLLRLLTFE